MTIASLDANNTGIATKTDIDIRYQLKDMDTGERLGALRTFDANVTAFIQPSFTVNEAHKNLAVEFTVCADYNGTGYTFYPYNHTDCSSNPSLECSTCPVNYYIIRYRNFNSTDLFADRPKEFSMTPPASTDIELLRSAVDYNFTVTAEDNTNSATSGYNQTKSNLDLNKTLIFKDLVEDDGTTGRDPLVGNLEFGSSDFYFNNGISTDSGGNNDVVGILFDDVAIVTIKLEDHNWAAVDSARITPSDCIGGTINNGVANLTIPYGAYVCVDQNATFIPDHFDLEYVRLSNNRLTRPFTYLTWQDDLNMSAAIELEIIAKNAVNDKTRNFKGGDSGIYYENPMEVNLTVPTQDENGNIIDNGEGTALEIVKHDINTSTYLGFNEGNRSIAWNDSNVSHRIMFNYNKEINKPINPFDINMSTASATEQAVTINIGSRYPESGTTTDGNSVTIVGEDNATGSARFYFTRIKPSRYNYFAVNTATQNTPIAINIYCDLDTFATTPCFDDYNISGQINDTEWWLAMGHNETLGDGNITLKIDLPANVIEGAGTPSVTTDVTVTSQGQDNTIVVTSNATTLPMSVEIDLDTSSFTLTSPWLIYNPDSDIVEPIPLYKVHFKSVGEWAGFGDTGHVVNSNASSKKNQRLEW